VPLAHRITKDVFIYDEAHNLIEQGGTPIKLWQHLFGWPDDLKDEIDLLDWAETTHTGVQSRDKMIQKVVKLLRKEDSDAVLEFDHEEYRGNLRRLLKITPLSCRSDKPIFWPKSVKKLILMSATINEYDIYNLGLDERRVMYIECDSEIPANNRPVIPLDIAPIRFHNYDLTIPKIVSEIERILDENPKPGVIHCTYEMASRLRQHLGTNSRLHWHSAGNRTTVYNSFIRGDLGNDAVLIACGMSEGVDLAYDKARWQIITKVPYRSLADSKVRENCKQNPHLYAWWAIRTIMQATGRVCRSADDYGITYVLDSNFSRLRKEWQELWPKYYQHSILDRGA
jgi:Rad3-related DNA helicase